MTNNNYYDKIERKKNNSEDADSQLKGKPMFWFKKKKPETEEVAEASNVEETAEDIELNKDLEDTENTENTDDASEPEENDGEDDEEDDGGETPPEDIPNLSVKIHSLDELTEFINGRRPGVLQFMRKSVPEVFEIREAHIRMARVWGTVSMVRECSPEEYGRIMLALELVQDTDAFYVLPGLTEARMKGLITEFCRDRYAGEEKKYAKNPDKFITLLKENGDTEEWVAFTKEAVWDIANEFCNNNGIVFDTEDSEEDE